MTSALALAPILRPTQNLRNSTSVLPDANPAPHGPWEHFPGQMGCARRCSVRRVLADEHAIAVTVEAVPRGDRMAVGGQHYFAAGKRANQRKQCGARQVEIRQKLID